MRMRGLRVRLAVASNQHLLSVVRKIFNSLAAIRSGHSVSWWKFNIPSKEEKTTRMQIEV